MPCYWGIFITFVEIWNKNARRTQADNRESVEQG